jgi:hypothetical protein
MGRMLAALGALGLCVVSVAAQPALGAGDRLLCAGDPVNGAILVPRPNAGPNPGPIATPPRAAGAHDPLLAFDGAVAPEAAGTLLQRWAGERFATPRNAQVLDTFFKGRTGTTAMTVTALDGYLVYQPVAAAAGGQPIERAVADRLRAAAARDLPLRACLTLKLPLWRETPVGLDQAAPTRFRELLARVGDAPVASLAEPRWAELLSAPARRKVMTTEAALGSSGAGN